MAQTAWRHKRRVALRLLLDEPGVVPRHGRAGARGPGRQLAPSRRRRDVGVGAITIRARPGALSARRDRLEPRPGELDLHRRDGGPRRGPPTPAR